MDWSDREAVLQKVREDGMNLKFASEALQGDGEVVLTALRTNLFALAFATEAVLADREVMLQAMQIHGGAYRFGPDELQDDREFIIEAIRRDRGEGSVLPFLRELWRSDREVIRAAVNVCGRALQFADPALRADREIVAEAVRFDGDALEYAAPELQSDHAIVMENLRGCLRHTPEALRSDKEFMMRAIKKEPFSFQFAVGGLNADREVIFLTLRQAGQAIRAVDWRMHDDGDFLLEAVRCNPDCAQWLHGKWSKSPVLVPEAVKNNPFAIPGGQGIVCNVTELKRDGDEIRYDATVGLAGKQASGKLPLDATLGALGQALRAVPLPGAAEPGAGDDGFVHLILPGKEAPVSPFDVFLPVSDFVA